MSMLPHQSSYGMNTTYLAAGLAPTRSSKRERGTPVHSAMNDQPSSQTCKVIWLRLGKRCSSDNEKEVGRATSPSTVSRQLSKLFASSCRYRSFAGGQPLTSGTFDIWLRSHSR